MFQTVAARLATGVNTDLAWRQLDTLLDAPTGDMFWTYPATCFWVWCRNRLDDSYRSRFRRLLRTYTPYRGDTENHFLMHYTYLLIFSEEWPEMREDEWFNGRSSAENHAEAREYLLHWFDETARYGLTEWDSPRYLYFYIAPLLALADGSRDTAISRRASMMAELLLADYAVEYLDGAYCGAHSRDGDGSVIDPRRSEATSTGRFYFEDRVDPPLPDLAFYALSRFTAPAVMRGLALDRSRNYTMVEYRRSRARMRDDTAKFGRVIKRTWMTADVALGSMEFPGIAQPIQQHTWGVNFGADRPNATIFAVHPDASEEELATYFPEEPELMESGILGSKASYGNEDRWIGGSRYEAVGQRDNKVIANYDLPSDVRWRHVDIFIPRSLDVLVRDSASPWIFCRMGKGMVAIHMAHDGNAAWTPRWIEEKANWRVRIGPTWEAMKGTRAALQLIVTCEQSTGDTVQDFQRFMQQSREEYLYGYPNAGGPKERIMITLPDNDYPDYITSAEVLMHRLVVNAQTAQARMEYNGVVRMLNFGDATITETRE